MTVAPAVVAEGPWSTHDSWVRAPRLRVVSAPSAVGRVRSPERRVLPGLRSRESDPAPTSFGSRSVHRPSSVIGQRESAGPVHRDEGIDQGARSDERQVLQTCLVALLPVLLSGGATAVRPCLTP